MSDIQIEWLGTVPYRDALAVQSAAVEARRRGETCDRLLLLEHPPVVTLGRSAKKENLLVDRAGLAARGIEIHEARRGGDVTYHAPGQLVGYLVVDLAARGARDVHAFLRTIEGGILDALATLGLRGKRVEGMTGVFVDAVPPDERRLERKIASIGVGVRHWVTCHGFALNVSLDLKGFEVIVPCGFDARSLSMASMKMAAFWGPVRLRRSSFTWAMVAPSVLSSFLVHPRANDGQGLLGMGVDQLSDSRSGICRKWKVCGGM